MEADTFKTFEKFQSIQQGDLHLLGDEILPQLFINDHLLRRLKPNGINSEGKTTKGTPDSYVGETPNKCILAVEYSTDKKVLAKYSKDYDSIRKKCPLAKKIYLCSSRYKSGIDTSKLRKKAAKDGVELILVDGMEFSSYLAKSAQHIREKYLHIPIDYLYGIALIRVMKQNLPLFLPKFKPGSTYIPRRLADEKLINPKKGKTYLIEALGGVGKTCWSSQLAQRFSGSIPVSWIAAKDLNTTLEDPISTAFVKSSYGISDITKIPDIIIELDQSNLCALVIVDGIDEIADTRKLIAFIKSFQRSALAPRVSLILTARKENWMLAAETSKIFKENEKETFERIALDELNEEQISILLKLEGASDVQIREIETTLSKSLFTNPFFALCALQIVKTEKRCHGRDIILEATESIIASILQFLQKEDPDLRASKIEKWLSEIAYSIFESACKYIDIDIIERITEKLRIKCPITYLIEQASRHNVLYITNNRVTFSHQYFLETFTAIHIRGQQGNWKNKLAPFVSKPEFYSVATRLVHLIERPYEVIDALLEVNADFAVRCTALIESTIPTELSSKLISLSRKLLDSRFTADKKLALKILALAKNQESKNVAVNWFNKLESNDKLKWRDDAGYLFLNLEVIGAFQLICRCHEFILASGLGLMAWYEPSFVRKLDALSPPFKNTIKDKAWSEFTKQDESNDYKQILFSILVLFHDERLLDWCAKYLDEKGALDIHHHRALIFINSAESLELYSKSIALHIKEWEKEKELPTKEREQLLDTRWNIMIIKQTDIQMFPHDKLISWCKAALNSDSEMLNRIGYEWAEILQSPDLSEEYATFKNKQSNLFVALTGRMYEKMLPFMDFNSIKNLFNSSNKDVQMEIIKALDMVPGNDTEDFLIEKAKDDEFKFYAIRSLGNLFAVSAGPLFRDALKDKSINIWLIACDALARIRYQPALHDLLEKLDKTLELNIGDKDVSNLEYSLIKAIAYIGGAEDLFIRFKKIRHQEEVIRYLMKTRDSKAIQYVEKIIQVYPEKYSALPKAIYTFKNINEKPWLTSRPLFDALCKGIQLTNLNKLDGILITQAINAFDLPEAAEKLEEIVNKSQDEDSVYSANKCLASRGNEKYIIKIVRDELSRLNKWNHLSYYNLQDLFLWPKAIVRNELLAHIDTEGSLTARDLYLLQHFAEEEDLLLFKKHEQHSDIHIANIAHTYLIDN